MSPREALAEGEAMTNYPARHNAARQAAEKWLAEWFYAVAQADVRLDSIPVEKLRVLASQLAPHAADFAERAVRGHFETCEECSDCWHECGQRIPWAAAVEAMEKK
jgi:hypothetical protein